MTVYELSKEQLEELKQKLLCDEYETTGKTPSYRELLAADSLVSDEKIFKEYESTVFTDDDFICSTEPQNNTKERKDNEMNAINFYKEKILSKYKNDGDYMNAVASASKDLSHDQYCKIQLAMKNLCGNSDKFNRVVYSWNPEMKLKDPLNVSDDNLSVLNDNYENTILVNHDQYGQTKRGLIYNLQSKEFALWTGQGLSASDKSDNVKEMSEKSIIDRARELAAAGFAEVKTRNPYADTCLASILPKKDLTTFSKSIPKIAAAELEKIRREDFMNEYFAVSGETPESIKKAAMNAKPDRPEADCDKLSPARWWQEAVDHAYRGCAIELMSNADEVKKLEKHGFIPKGSFDNDKIFEHLIDSGKSVAMVTKIMFEFLKDKNVIKPSVKPSKNINLSLEH